MPAAAALLLAPDDLAELRRWERSSQLPAVLAQRARILLLAAEGITNTEIAKRVGVSRPTGTTADRASDPPGRDLVGHPQSATNQAGDHPLVDSAAGP